MGRGGKRDLLHVLGGVGLPGLGELFVPRFVILSLVYYFSITLGHDCRGSTCLRFFGLLLLLLLLTSPLLALDCTCEKQLVGSTSDPTQTRRCRPSFATFFSPA